MPACESTTASDRPHSQPSVPFICVRHSPGSDPSRCRLAWSAEQPSVSTFVPGIGPSTLAYMNDRPTVALTGKGSPSMSSDRFSRDRRPNTSFGFTTDVADLKRALQAFAPMSNCLVCISASPGAVMQMQKSSPWRASPKCLTRITCCSCGSVVQP
jgi:hypothetical protein